MSKVSINNLAEYSERMNTPALPTDEFQLTINRAARDWFVADLIKRKKRLSQAVNDPKTRMAKRVKRHGELHMLSVTLERLQSAEKV